MTEGATPGRGGEGDLLERIAAALRADSGDGSSSAPFSPPQRARLLRLARDIAHSGERQDAPLASYLIGRFVERRRAAGVPEEAAIGEAAALIDGLTAEAAPPEGGDLPGGGEAPGGASEAGATA
jgi:hypothetical protein